MECPGCAGRGCPGCSGAGRLDITECPLKYVGMETWEIVEYADLYEKGLPPVAGGALDQAQGFLDAARFVMAERQYWKARLKIMT